MNGVRNVGMTIRIGDRARCKDGVEGNVSGWHKYGRELHVVIKTDAGEERELNLSDYCKSGIQLLP